MKYPEKYLLKMDTKLRNQLLAYSERTDTPMAQIARKAIEQFIDEQGAK